MAAADDYGVSSAHLTFNTAEEAATLAEAGYLR
jgi:predicted N-acyltransferase